MKEKEDNLLSVLKKFPDQNPNPVMQITDEGILKYYNEPSRLIVNEIGLEIDKKIVSWLLDEIKKTIDIDVHTFEIDLNLKSFQFKSVYIKELNSIFIGITSFPSAWILPEQKTLNNLLTDQLKKLIH